MSESELVHLHGRGRHDTVGQCCVPGCDHPYLAPGSDYCMVHDRLLYDFRVWLKHDLADTVDTSARVRRQHGLV